MTLIPHPAASTLETSTDVLRIGGHNSPSATHSSWSSRIDNVRIYYHADLPSEILAIYKGTGAL